VSCKGEHLLLSADKSPDLAEELLQEAEKAKILTPVFGQTPLDPYGDASE